ncbi:tol-pal system protein YbgF [Halioxenophilus aromaticivorans]|uniref:Cell division coordinator CpoB n=1 Tax=Halioxenophilus aromaticivorans TaxID=1306992 RepID=A0AAV3TXD8_9ALTE
MMHVFAKRVMQCVVATSLGVAAGHTFAQAQVIDSRPATRASTAGASTTTAGNISSQMFGRMQQLEQEVLDLRGLVEQQAFEIKRLKQQRLDDYTDLDQRISNLMSSQGAAAPSAAPSRSSTSNAAASQPISGAKPVSERGLYSDALSLLLQKKDFDGSASKLNQYLKSYPNGLFTPNAYYWLGEISLSKQDLQDSQQWFSRLLKEYPGHNKAPDAKFKLGKLYFQLGDKGNAKSMLSEVAAGGTPAAQLAKDFMSVNGLL